MTTPTNYSQDQACCNLCRQRSHLLADMKTIQAEADCIAATSNVGHVIGRARRIASTAAAALARAGEAQS